MYLLVGSLLGKKENHASLSFAVPSNSQICQEYEALNCTFFLYSQIALKVWEYNNWNYILTSRSSRNSLLPPPAPSFWLFYNLNMIIGFGITTKCIASTFKRPILIESVLNKLLCSLSLNCYYLCSQRAGNYNPWWPFQPHTRKDSPLLCKYGTLPKFSCCSW